MKEMAEAGGAMAYHSSFNTAMATFNHFDSKPQKILYNILSNCDDEGTLPLIHTCQQSAGDVQIINSV